MRKFNATFSCNEEELDVLHQALHLVKEKYPKWEAAKLMAQRVAVAIEYRERKATNADAQKQVG